MNDDHECCEFDDTNLNKFVRAQVELNLVPGTNFHQVMTTFYSYVIRMVVLHPEAWSNVPYIDPELISGLGLDDETTKRLLRENETRGVEGMTVDQTFFDEAIEIPQDVLDAAVRASADERLKCFKPSRVPDSLEAWCAEDSNEETDR